MKPISKKSFLAKSYCFFYCTDPKHLTDNFCPFFWGWLFLIVTGPFLWIGAIAVNIINFRRKLNYGATSWIFNFLATIFVLGVSILLSMAVQHIILHPIEFVINTGILVGVLVAIALLFYLIVTYEDSFTIIETKISSVKDKYCPKITWKD